MLSGVLASVSSIPYYIALKNEEATGAAIFYQIQPLFYLLAGALFFHEAISLPQIIALIIIMIAPALIILSRKHKKSRQMQIRAGALLVLYVFCWRCPALLARTPAMKTITQLSSFTSCWDADFRM